MEGAATPAPRASSCPSKTDRLREGAIAKVGYECVCVRARGGGRAEYTNNAAGGGGGGGGGEGGEGVQSKFSDKADPDRARATPA